MFRNHKYKLILLTLLVLAAPKLSKASQAGYTSIGTNFAAAPNAQIASYLVPLESGTVTSASIYFGNVDATNKQFGIALYSSAGALIAKSSNATAVANSWNTVSLSATLTAGSGYFLAANTNGNNSYALAAQSGNGILNVAQTFGTWPATFPSGGSVTANAIFSAYLTFTSTTPTPAAWVAPIGIPTPSFGVNETIASLHGGNANYISKYVTGGGDLNTKMPALAAGDVVFIDSGNYTVTAGTSWNAAGTSANPIIVMGNPANPPVIKITGGGDTLNLTGSYGIFDNLRFDLTTEGSTVAVSGNHLTLRNSEAWGGPQWTPNTAVFVIGTNNVVYHNKIHDNGHTTGCPNGDPNSANCDPDFHGVGVSGDHDWFVDNLIYRNGGDGGQFRGDTTMNHIYVGRNESWGNRQDGFWVKGGSDFIFSQNYLHDNNLPNTGFAAGVGSQYGSERVWFLYNNIANNSQGITVSSNGNDGATPAGHPTHEYFIGNVFHGNQQEDIIVLGDEAARHFINNTMYGGTVGISWDIPTAGTEVKNNVVVNNSGTDFEFDYGQAGNVTMTNNSCGTTACSVIYGAGLSCTSCVVGSPNFVNATGSDFRLNSTSALIDKGTASTSVYSTFQSLYGLNIAVDAAGASRPVGASWDIGAYEFGTATATPLSGDINLDHIVNSVDYSILNSDWFTSSSRSDLNHDGLVNSLDYSILNGNWFKTW